MSTVESAINDFRPPTLSFPERFENEFGSSQRVNTSTRQAKPQTLHAFHNLLHGRPLTVKYDSGLIRSLLDRVDYWLERDAPPPPQWQLLISSLQTRCLDHTLTRPIDVISEQNLQSVIVDMLRIVNVLYSDPKTYFPRLIREHPSLVNTVVATWKESTTPNQSGVTDVVNMSRQMDVFRRFLCLCLMEIKLPGVWSTRPRENLLAAAQPGFTMTLRTETSAERDLRERERKAMAMEKGERFQPSPNLRSKFVFSDPRLVKKDADFLSQIVEEIDKYSCDDVIANIWIHMGFFRMDRGTSTLYVSDIVPSSSPDFLRVLIASGLPNAVLPSHYPRSAASTSVQAHSGLPPRTASPRGAADTVSRSLPSKSLAPLVLKSQSFPYEATNRRAKMRWDCERIQLEISTPPSYNERYLRWRHELDSVTFSLLEPGKPPSPPKTETPAVLKLESMIGSGRTSDVFRASLHGRSVVVKVCIPELIEQPEEDCDSDEGQKFASTSHVRARIIREARLYSGPMASLQGSVVPEFFGLFIGRLQAGGLPDSEVYLTVIGDAGEAVVEDPEDLPSLPLQTRKEIVGLYQQLHAVGICHNDVEARHIRIDINGRIKLIDFENSYESTVGDSWLTQELQSVQSELSLLV